MTRRALMLLDALEDGRETRGEIFAHQGRFSLLNNAAAELRAAGIPVSCDVIDSEYHYRLLDERGTVPPAPLVEEPSGQMQAGVNAYALTERVGLRAARGEGLPKGGTPKTRRKQRSDNVPDASATEPAPRSVSAYTNLEGLAEEPSGVTTSPACARADVTDSIQAHALESSSAGNTEDVQLSWEIAA